MHGGRIFLLLISLLSCGVACAQSDYASILYHPTSCNQKLGASIEVELSSEILALNPTKIKFELLIIEGSVFTNEFPDNWSALCTDTVGINNEPDWIIFPPAEEQWGYVKITTLDIPVSGSLSKHITIDLSQRPDINTGFMSCPEISDLFELGGVGIEIDEEWVLLDSWEDCSIILSNKELELHHSSDIFSLLETFENDIELAIFNVQGQSIRQFSSVNNLPMQQDILYDLDSGVYIVQLWHHDQYWSQKVILSH